MILIIVKIPKGSLLVLFEKHGCVQINRQIIYKLYLTLQYAQMSHL